MTGGSFRSTNPLTVGFFSKLELKILDYKKSIAILQHDEEHDFLFHLVNSAVIETNHEDTNILITWSIIFDFEKACMLIIDTFSQTL